MKTKELKYGESTYTVKAMGFFKANRLLLDKIKPLLPTIISAAKKSQANTTEPEKDGNSDLTEILTEVLEAVNADLVEEIIKTVLHKVSIETSDSEIQDLDIDSVDDYELVIELLKTGFSLNYSSLGKLMTRLKGMSNKEASQE